MRRLAVPGALPLLAHRHVTLLKHYDDAAYLPGQSCPLPDNFSAVVRFDGAVAEVRAPALEDGETSSRSPFDSEPGLELLARSLERRQ